MHLPQEDIDLFFKLHPALLQYVNEKLQLLPDIHTPRGLQYSGLQNVAHVQEKLWNRPRFIDEFVSDNPHSFTDDELAIVKNWKNAVRGSFYIVRHLKKHTVFMTAAERPIAYGVRSLFSPLREMFPQLPVYVDATLIPFNKMITYDGVIRPYPIVFGRGYKFDIEEHYRRARELSSILSNLNDNLSDL